MLECKLSVQAEPFNVEPSGCPAFPPMAGAGERSPQTNACRHAGSMFHSTKAWHLLRMQVGGLTLTSQTNPMSVGVNRY